MKVLKNYNDFNLINEGIFDKFKNKKNIPGTPKTYKDNDKIVKIFNDIKNNFDMEKLSIQHTGLYGSNYFYEINDGVFLDVSPYFIRLSKEILDVDKKIIKEVVDYFETKGLGSIIDIPAHPN